MAPAGCRGRRWPILCRGAPGCVPRTRADPQSVYRIEAGDSEKFPVALHAPIYPPRPHFLTSSPASDLNSGQWRPLSRSLTRYWHAFGSPPQAHTLTAPFGPSRTLEGAPDGLQRTAPPEDGSTADPPTFRSSPGTSSNAGACLPRPQNAPRCPTLAR